MSLCSICQKEALPEQGLHGLSGDHYDCYRSRLVGILGYDPDDEFNAAAAGGQMRIHRVKGNTSLCGHTPEDRPGSSMRRARWVRYNRAVTCRHCLLAMGTDANRRADREHS